MKIFFKVCAIMLLSMPFLASAQNDVTYPMTGSLEVLAEVNVRDPHIVVQKENDITVAFDIANGKGVQSHVRYSLGLVDLGGNKAYQKIYDEKITLAENSVQKRTVDLRVPAYLFGEYNVWVYVENEDGMPLSGNVAGKASFKYVETQMIEIAESTCKLYIKGLPEDYALTQGVDVSVDEELHLACEAKNYFTKEMQAEIASVTKLRTQYGNVVSVEELPQTITFAPDEQKRIDYVIPKPQTPQAYDVSIVLKEGGKEISNPIRIHYVVQGETASISNAQIDKSTYEKDEELVLTFFWGLNADSFEGSRSGSTQATEAYASLRVTDGGAADCIKPITHQKIDREKALSTLRASVIAACKKPFVTLSIEREDGTVLVKKDYDFSSKDQITAEAELKKKSDGFNASIFGWIIVGVLLVISFGVIIYHVIKKKRGFGVFLIFVFCGSAFLMTGAQAGTVGSYLANCDFTISPQVVSPGQAVDVYVTRCGLGVCANDYSVGYFINGERLPYAYKASYYAILKGGTGFLSFFSAPVDSDKYNTLAECQNGMAAKGYRATTSFFSFSGVSCGQPRVVKSSGQFVAPQSCGVQKIPVAVELYNHAKSPYLRGHWDGTVEYTVTNCCTPSNACAASTCIGQTCSDGCGGLVNGTKNCCATTALPQYAQKCAGSENNVPKNGQEWTPIETCDGATKCSYTLKPACGVDADKTISAKKPEEDCKNGSTLNGSISYKDGGLWKWSCKNDKAKPQEIACSVPSCLASQPFTLPSFVYLNADNVPGKATAKMNCDGSNVCCNIQEQGNADNKITICQQGINNEDQLNVTTQNAEFNAECWYDEGAIGTRENEDIISFRSFVKIMCTSRTCNKQGTCQATPKEATNINECSNTCATNADCDGGGKVIETRP